MSAPGPQDPLDEATLDLLIKQVTEGLSPAEQRELDVLDSAVTSDNLQKFERAAAAAALAGSRSAQPLPAALKQRLEQEAQNFLKIDQADPRPATNVVDLPKAPAVRRSNAASAYGWLAAAACLVLAVFAWNRSPPPVPVVQVVTAPTEPAPPVRAPVPPTPAEERAALLANSGSVKIAFNATKDPAAAGVSGDVVWDPVTQRGFLHFVGLAPNDPAVHQYQLWIFDGGRDKRYPVDGGVFDIPADSTDVVVPIHATLPVLSAKAFAVTVEKPGGVVVSGREHVVVLGAAS
jgi:hypothetical protein